MPKQPIQEELSRLKDSFLKSINDYLDDCILHKDIRRMKRFVSKVWDILKQEISRSTG